MVLATYLKKYCLLSYTNTDELHLMSRAVFRDTADGVASWGRNPELQLR